MSVAIDHVYRADSRRILATLIRLLGDFDLAEEAMQDAFAAALTRWPEEGVPLHPRPWLIAAGRFRAIDRLRRGTRIHVGDSEAITALRSASAPTEDAWIDEEDGVADDRSRLVFICCHPALSADAQIALTLRTVCGLATEEIARAFLVSPTTIAQRIVRAKAKIRDARIPFQLPSRSDLPERLDTVMHVVYLLFNEGYSASTGTTVTRDVLSSEAIRLARLLMELLDEPEICALLALMLLHEARRDTRSDAAGDIVLLEDQDRSQWNHTMIAEGAALVQRALTPQTGRPYSPGRYVLQAAIAAVHAESPTAASTDWAQIVALYDRLLALEASPVVQLNRAVAIAMRDGVDTGLILMEQLMQDTVFDHYGVAHTAHAELARRAGRVDDARQSFTRALALAAQEPERRFLERRLAMLTMS